MTFDRLHLIGRASQQLGWLRTFRLVTARSRQAGSLPSRSPTQRGPCNLILNLARVEQVGSACAAGGRRTRRAIAPNRPAPAVLMASLPHDMAQAVTLGRSTSYLRLPPSAHTNPSRGIATTSTCHLALFRRVRMARRVRTAPTARSRLICAVAHTSLLISGRHCYPGNSLSHRPRMSCDYSSDFPTASLQRRRQHGARRSGAALARGMAPNHRAPTVAELREALVRSTAPHTAQCEGAPCRLSCRGKPRRCAPFARPVVDFSQPVRVDRGRSSPVKKNRSAGWRCARVVRCMPHPVLLAPRHRLSPLPVSAPRALGRRGVALRVTWWIEDESLWTA